MRAASRPARLGRPLQTCLAIQLSKSCRGKRRELPILIAESLRFSPTWVHSFLRFRGVGGVGPTRRVQELVDPFPGRPSASVASAASRFSARDRRPIRISSACGGRSALPRVRRAHPSARRISDPDGLRDAPRRPPPLASDLTKPPAGPFPPRPVAGLHPVRPPPHAHPTPSRQNFPAPRAQRARRSSPRAPSHQSSSCGGARGGAGRAATLSRPRCSRMRTIVSP